VIKQVMPQLRFYNKDQVLFTHRWDDKLLRIGRGDDCDLRFDDPLMSRLHLILRNREGKIYAEDCSLNGSQIEGQQTAGPNTPLVPGQACELTKNIFFKIEAQNSPSAKTLLKAEHLTVLLPPQQSSPHEISIGEARIEVKDPGGRIISRDLNLSGLSIGRHSSNDIIIDDPYVSQFHLQIEVRHGEIIAKDLGSANGLRLNHQELDTCRLQSDQEVQFGNSSLCLRVKLEKQSILPKDSSKFFGIVSQNKIMRRNFSLIEIAARSTHPVFFHGETGTGKELFSRALHDLSARSDKTFLAINCAALPKDLVESELFGHEKGAFTSATHTREGAFEVANGGTLFLDECGELDLSVQAKLLRVLETGQYCRVGSHEERRADVRIVTATHRDLRQLVNEGKFREDLFYRLHVIPISIPPLRERIEDLPLLVPALLASLQIEAKWADDAMEMLRAYAFPGNVRELKNILSRAAIEMQLLKIDRPKSTEAVITAEHLRFLPGLEKYRPVQNSNEKMERETLLACLERHDFNQTNAARELQLAISSLHDKMKRFNIVNPRKKSK